MYYIAYDNGAKITDGEVATVADALAALPGDWQHAGSLGDERKFTDAAQPGRAIYVRPHRSGIRT